MTSKRRKRSRSQRHRRKVGVDRFRNNTGPVGQMRDAWWLIQHAERARVEQSADVDLHRCSREDARAIMVRAFREAYRANKTQLIVNHGAGTGVMKTLVYNQSVEFCREALRPILGRGFKLELTVKPWNLDPNWAFIEFVANLKHGK